MKNINQRNKLKILSIGEAILIIALTCISTSAARENNGPIPLIHSHGQIQIDELTIFEFTDPYFEIHTCITNYANYGINITIRHTLTKPDGTKEQPSWDQLIISRFQSVYYYIYCMYMDNDPFGEYSWTVTVTDENGDLFDRETVSWIREPISQIKDP